MLKTKIEFFFIFYNCLYLICIIKTSEANCGCSQPQRTNQEASNVVATDAATEQCLPPKNSPGNDEFCSLNKPDNEFQQNNDMVLIPSGKYWIGSAEILKSDREWPEQEIPLKAFQLDKTEVSNQKFHEFVEATGYKTDAEKFGDSFQFEGLLSTDIRAKYQDFRVVNALWWYKINGTNWLHPDGPESNLENRWMHPVVHVSWHDAVAYCRWREKRLPTEFEWEAACRNGGRGKLFPWGDTYLRNGVHQMNIWQGQFPRINLKKDGYFATNPVTEFQQTDTKLYNMIGNVWEWTADLWNNSDADADANTVQRVKKGGSYLCHKSYCYRYRCGARSQNTADSSTGNLGFRCAKSV